MFGPPGKGVNDEGTANAIKAEDCLWDYRDLRDWEDRLVELRKLDIDDKYIYLDKFCHFFAKTVDKICMCLVNHERIPQDLFCVRDIYVEKVTDLHIEFVNAHIKALL